MVKVVLTILISAVVLALVIAKLFRESTHEATMSPPRPELTLWTPAALKAENESSAPPPKLETLPKEEPGGVVHVALYEGQVVDREGHPVSDALVSVRGSLASRTDENGAFRLQDLEANSFTLSVERQGFLPWLKSVLPHALPHRLVLSRGGTLRLNPRWEETGENIAVTLLCLNGRRFHRTVKKPEPEGPVEISGLHPGAYECLVRDERTLGDLYIVELEADKVAEIRYPLSPGRPFRVGVETEAHTPVVGAEVLVRVLADEGQERGAFPSAAGLTDDEGLCELGTLGSALCDLRVRAKGYAPVLVTDLAAEMTNELRITVRESGSLLVRVRDPKGQPVAGVRVDLSTPRRRVSSHNVTDADGHTSFGGLAEDVHTVSLSRDELSRGPFYVETIGGREVKSDLLWPFTASVNGKVLRNGVPVTGGHLYFDGEKSRRDTQIRPGGTFAVDLPHDERFAVTLMSEYTTVRLGVLDPQRSDEAVFDGVAYPVTIEVLTSIDVSAAGLRLSVRQIDGETTGSQAVTADCRVTWSALPPGNYIASARAVFVGRPPLTQYCPALEFEVRGPTHVVYRCQDTQPLELPVAMEKLGYTRVFRFATGGALTTIDIERYRPFAVRWPMGHAGVGVLESGRWAPTFFEVVDNDLTGPFDVKEGGNIEASAVLDDITHEVTYRVEPLSPGCGPSSYWATKLFGPWGTNDLSLPPGKYRVYPEVPRLNTSAIAEVVAGETTVVQF